MLHRTTIASSLISLLALTSCADSLAKRLEDSPDRGELSGGASRGEGDPEVVGEIITTEIDASSQTETVYFDLDRGREVAEGDGWDLSFRRFHVQMNGGVSGTGGVQAVIVDDASFEELERAPEDGYSTDVADGDADNDGDPDNLFNNGENDWYDYDVADHTLTSKKLTYVVVSTERELYKLVIDDYYDAAGSPAFLRVRWARLAGPAPELAPGEDADPRGDEPDQVTGASTADDGGAAHAGEGDAAPAGDGGAAHAGDAGQDADVAMTQTFEVTVDASSSTEWVYVSAEGELVTPQDPANSLAWDLGFKRTELRTNSGASGVGSGGAKREQRALSFAQIVDADTLDFTIDEVLNSGAPGATTSSQNAVLSDWYDYDVMTHVVTPSDLSFIVRTAGGGLAKLRILSWKDGVFTIAVGPVAPRSS